MIGNRNHSSPSRRHRRCGSVTVRRAENVYFRCYSIHLSGVQETNAIVTELHESKDCLQMHANVYGFRCVTGSSFGFCGAAYRALISFIKI